MALGSNESVEFDIVVNGKPAKQSIEDVEKAQTDLDKTVGKTSKNIKTNWMAIGVAAAAVAASMGAMMKSALDLERVLFGLNEETKEWIKNASEQYGMSQQIIAGFVQTGKAAGMAGDDIAKMIDQAVALGRAYPHESTESFIDNLVMLNRTGEAQGFIVDVLEQKYGLIDLKTLSLAQKQEALEEATRGVNKAFDETNASEYDKSLQELTNTATSLGDSLIVLADESGIIWAANKVMEAGALAATGYAMAMNRALAVMYDVGNYDTSELDASFDKLKELSDEKFGKLFGVDKGVDLGTISISGKARPPTVSGTTSGATAEADKEREIALRANERFWDEYNRATQSALEYEMGLLDKQYEEYDKHVKDKAALDEWYNEEKIRLLEDYDTQMKAYADMADSVTRGLTDGIMEFTQTGKLNFKEMTNSIIQDMLKIQIQQSMSSLFGGFSSTGGGMLGSLFTSMFAKGDAFSNGSITPFATGGVVSSPTLFPMANGAGLMGEAGAEAIMPLTRTSGGDLGVKMEGGGTTVNVNVQNYGNDNVSVEQTGDSVNIIIAEIASTINRGTSPIGDAIENRYALRKT